MATELPIDSNEYVGVTYGNILDRYDNPAYNLKLYMIRNPENADDEEASKNPSLAAAPADTVVLAQTGVTGTQIDNLSIINKIAASMKTTRVRFTISQPGAADFLDQIQLAKTYLGIPLSVDTVVFLEVVFKGYTTDIEDVDAAGEIATIAGPYRWKLRLTNINISIDNTGSVYECEALPLATYAFRDPIYKLPMNLQTIGQSITEHLADLEKKLNEWHSEAATNEVSDVIKIDPSQLIGTGSGGVNSLDIITDDSLMTSKDADAETLNRKTNEMWELGTAIDRQQNLETAPKYTGTEAEKIFDEDIITHRQGTSLERVLAVLLSMCPEFYSKISRKQDPTDPDSEIKNDQAYVSWFKIVTKTKQLQYDKSRNEYAYEYTFTPVLYKTVRPDVALDAKEVDLESPDADARVSQIKANNGLYKSYQYLFSGLNDQIINLDIKYDNGIALLTAPKDGTIGDISLAASTQLQSQIPENKDVTLEGAIKEFHDAANFIKDRNKFTNFLGEVRDRIDNVSESFIGALSDATGFSPADISNAITDSTGRAAEALTDALDSATLNRVAAQARINQSGTPTVTEDPETTTSADGTTYEPAFSGYAYSADILNPGDQNVTVAADLLDLGYLTANVKESALKQAKSSNQDIPNSTEAATYQSGSPRNKLFGLITNQHAADKFLLQLEMRLRGDPWYLGSPGLQQSSPEAANYNKDDVCFWLQIRSPITYDPDFTDEDSDLNSGYWKYDGINRSYSALYRIFEVTNEFSSGLYSVEVRSQRTQLDANLVSKKTSDSETTEQADTQDATAAQGSTTEGTGDGEE